MTISRSYRYGLTASGALLLLYGITMTTLSGWDAAVAQFQALWWLMVPLAVGFGVQVTLYTKLKQTLREKAKAAVAAGGTSAGLGILACCVHHVTDVLPIIGLSGLSFFLVQYQAPLLLVSLAINVVGILFIINQLKRAIATQIQAAA